VLTAAIRALPQSVVATILLMAFLVWVLVVLLHVDPLTAYLATSPGGVDAAAIIAASTKVDMPFVMALQTFRMLTLLAVGPVVARWVAGTLDPQPPTPEADRAPDLLPRVNLARVNLKTARQLRNRAFLTKRCYCHFRLEFRIVLLACLRHL
jgi:hypothetical protein